MASEKHLVLERDVHLRLKEKKRQTGASAKEIANSILRSVLSRPTLTELIGEKLVQMGKLTTDEYARITAEVIKDAQSIATPFDSVIRITSRKTLTTGSWEAREIYRSPDDTFQLVEGWARDERKNPTGIHYHEQYESIVVLTGKVAVQIETKEQILSPMDTICIKPHAVHSTTPLTPDTHVVVINNPTWPDYVGRQEVR